MEKLNIKNLEQNLDIDALKFRNLGKIQNHLISVPKFGNSRLKIWFLEAKLLFPTMHVSLVLISWTMPIRDAQLGSMDGANSEMDFHSVTCSWRQREESLLEEFVNKKWGN